MKWVRRYYEMSKKKLNGADYLLLLLYLNEKKPIYGAIRLTKMMFLFNEEIAPLLKKSGAECQKLPEFIAYNYGPFSKDVYEQIELFRGIKFIQVTDIKAQEEMAEVDDWEEMAFTEEVSSQGYSLNTNGSYYRYQLLSTGERFVKENIINELTAEQINILSQFKQKISELSPKQILKYVYTKYPKYTEKSLIKKEVLDNE